MRNSSHPNGSSDGDSVHDDGSVLEQRLSDFMDGMMSPAEVEAFEAEIQSTPSIANRLSAMQSDRQTLRSLSVLPTNKLRPNFAAEVVAAAQKRAVGEGLPDKHPLRRSINRDPVALPRRSSISVARVAAIVASIAAITLLIFALRTDDAPSGKALQTIAMVDSATEPATIEPDVPKRIGLTEQPTELANDLNSPVRDDEATNPRLPSRSTFADTEPTEISPVQTDASGHPPVHGDRSIALQPPVIKPTNDFSGTLNGVVLVYDVRLTELGRASRAVSVAMERAGLEATSKQAIDSDVVSVAKRSTQLDKQDGFQILFLQAPAKQLDRLFSELLRDEAGVNSVGMTLATDAPVLRIAKSLAQVDPTQVVQEPVSYQIRGDDQETTNQLSGLLSDRTFFPIPKRKQPTASASSEITSGQDILGRVLVLVR